MSIILNLGVFKVPAIIVTELREPSRKLGYRRLSRTHGGALIRRHRPFRASVVTENEIAYFEKLLSGTIVGESWESSRATWSSCILIHALHSKLSHRGAARLCRSPFEAECSRSYGAVVTLEVLFC